MRSLRFTLIAIWGLSKILSANSELVILAICTPPRTSFCFYCRTNVCGCKEKFVEKNTQPKLPGKIVLQNSTKLFHFFAKIIPTEHTNVLAANHQVSG